ncbi:MAG: hypothetical protein NC429_04630 [Lachnospiraceae bacterium]|nr:hypothetical protein [Lachnospiraceae bacterium]
MRIGAMGAMDFRPYIYNTNRLSGNSLSKVSPIGKDLVSSKTDFSGLTDEDLNENPLRRGQTSNFMDVLNKQMQTGRLNASRLIKPAGKADMTSVSDTADKLQSAGQQGEASFMQYDRNLFQMQKAAESYRVNMIA